MENNQVKIKGRLVRSPKAFTVKTDRGDQLRVSFTLAVGGGGSAVAFVPCSAWGRVAELVNKREQGDFFGVVGRIRTSSYVKKDGSTVYVVEVVAEGITENIVASGGVVESW